MRWYLHALRHFADFQGRARRREFWIFQLVTAIIGVCVIAFDYAVGNDLAYLGYVAVVFLPALAVAVRRLHDTGRSGWWYLLAFVPLASIALLAIACMDSDDDNRYGPNPKTVL